MKKISVLGYAVLESHTTISFEGETAVLTKQGTDPKEMPVMDAFAHIAKDPVISLTDGGVPPEEANWYVSNEDGDEVTSETPAAANSLVGMLTTLSLLA